MRTRTPTFRVPVSQLFPRQIRPDEMPHVRQVWWSQVRSGHRLPAERGIILIPGGRP